MPDSNIEVVRAYLAAVEAFDVAAVGALIDPSIVQTEYPNRLYPHGQVRGREELERDLPKGAAILRRQAYAIETIFGSGDQVAVAARWTGVLNVALGALVPGDGMVAHICMIFTLQDGRIVAQRNYDCYEDFPATAP